MTELRKTALGSRFLFDHARANLCSLDAGSLSGLRHRTVIDRRVGSRSLALWQEEHLPGFEVPPHRHDCEEIITIIHGVIEATMEDAVIRVASGQSLLIPEWALHGFRVTGNQKLLLLALFGSANPRIFRADGQLSEPPWEGGHSDHLVRG